MPWDKTHDYANTCETRNSVKILTFASRKSFSSLANKLGAAFVSACDAELRVRHLWTARPIIAPRTTTLARRPIVGQWLLPLAHFRQEASPAHGMKKSAAHSEHKGPTNSGPQYASWPVAWFGPGHEREPKRHSRTSFDSSPERQYPSSSFQSEIELPASHVTWGGHDAHFPSRR